MKWILRANWIIFALYAGIACSHIDKIEESVRSISISTPDPYVSPAAPAQVPGLTCTLPACPAGSTRVCAAQDGCQIGCGMVCVLDATAEPSQNAENVEQNTIVQPGQSSTDGAQNPASAGSIPTEWEPLAGWVVNAYRSQRSLSDVHRELTTNMRQNDGKDWIAADLTGDGRDEWVLQMYPQMRNGYSTVWIIGAEGLMWQLKPHNSVETGQPTSGPTTLTLGDLTGDGLSELIIGIPTCGASTCSTSYVIVSSASGPLRNIVQRNDGTGGANVIGLTYSDISFNDYTDDGIRDLRIHGGDQGGAGAGKVRTYAEIWSWQADRQRIMLQSVELDPTNVRYHLIYEANALARSGNTAQALALYEQVINDPSLENTPLFEPDADIYGDSRQFAAFRLAYLSLTQGFAPRADAWANWLTTNYANTPISQAAQQLMTTFDKTQSTDEACHDALVELNRLTTEPAGSIAYLGYANPPIELADFCP